LEDERMYGPEEGSLKYRFLNSADTVIYIGLKLALNFHGVSILLFRARIRVKS
jgi:hypothetical protein